MNVLRLNPNPPTEFQSVCNVHLTLRYSNANDAKMNCTNNNHTGSYITDRTGETTQYNLNVYSPAVSYMNCSGKKKSVNVVIYGKLPSLLQCIFEDLIYSAVEEPTVIDAVCLCAHAGGTSMFPRPA